MEDRHSGFLYTTFKRHWISYPERLGTAASIGAEGPTAGGKERDAANGVRGRGSSRNQRTAQHGAGARLKKKTITSKAGDAFYSFNST